MAETKAMESLNETIINRLKEEESLMREVLRNIHDFSDESKHAFFKEARKEYFKVLRMLSHNYGVDCTEHTCLCFMLADMFLYKSDVSDNSKKKKKYPLAIFFVAHKMLKTTFPCSHELCEVVKMYRLPYFTGDKKTTRKKSVIHAEQKLLESLDFHLHILTPWALLTEVVSLAPESWKKTFMRAIKIAMEAVVEELDTKEMPPSLAVACVIDNIAWYMMEPVKTHTVFNLEFIPSSFRDAMLVKAGGVEMFRDDFPEMHLHLVEFLGK